MLGTRRRHRRGARRGRRSLGAAGRGRDARLRRLLGLRRPRPGAAPAAARRRPLGADRDAGRPAGARSPPPTTRGCARPPRCAGPAPRRSAARRSPAGWSRARSTARSTSPRRWSCAATRSAPRRPRRARAAARRRRWRFWLAALAIAGARRWPRVAGRRRLRGLPDGSSSTLGPATLALAAARCRCAAPRCRLAPALGQAAPAPWLSPRRRSRFDCAFSLPLPGRGRAGAARRRPARSTPGEFVVLAGRSGSGKSTLLRAACGLVPHFHGGEVGGRARGRGPRRRASTARPSSAAVGRLRRPGARDPGGLDHGARRARAAAGAARRAAGRAGPRGRGGGAGAGDRRTCSTAPTDTLSGGELQRVALAAALVTRPRAGAARRADLAARPGRRRRADRRCCAA